MRSSSSWTPEGGVIRFAGQRALLLDAVAMGLLRKYLVENFGLTAARTVLTQFGFAHGWPRAPAARADVAVCGPISGLTSGYRGRTAGKETYVLEDRCMGKGDAACHLFGRSREEWGDERAEEVRFFEPHRLQECLDGAEPGHPETLVAQRHRLVPEVHPRVRVARDVAE